MTTGSFCLTEILKSRKPCSSNSEASQSADSTSASGVALPYFSSSRLSSEPALTPMRIGMPAAVAALAISPTLSSKALMLPGLTRTAAHPASIAAKTYFGWKWMSAITGICDLRAIAGRASASSWLGQATRTIWQPDAVSSAICCRVALTSVVGVVVIDCTETGAPPPTSTPPTSICRVTRRSASGRGGSSGMPRLTDVMAPLSRTATSRPAVVVARRPERGLLGLLQPHGVHDVRGQRQHREATEEQDHRVGHRQQLVVVHSARVLLALTCGQPRARLLVPRDRYVPAVERQQREEVEDADEHVEAAEQQQEEDRLAQLDGLAADAAGPDDADGRLGVALLAAERVDQLGDLGGEL